MIPHLQVQCSVSAPAFQLLCPARAQSIGITKLALVLLALPRAHRGSMSLVLAQRTLCVAIAVSALLVNIFLVAVRAAMQHARLARINMNRCSVEVRMSRYPCIPALACCRATALGSVLAPIIMLVVAVCRAPLRSAPQECTELPAPKIRMAPAPLAQTCQVSPRSPVPVIHTM